MSRRVEDETTVNERYSVAVPAAVRRIAGIEAGDELRWIVDGGDHLRRAGRQAVRLVLRTRSGRHRRGDTRRGGPRPGRWRALMARVVVDANLLIAASMDRQGIEYLY
jgi:bifunctional DNA-binding transcriptional regulator/antitoxin component of YhaV-PrlF toxin-antitoxin module